jgi:hypothetical protein
LLDDRMPPPRSFEVRLNDRLPEKEPQFTSIYLMPLDPPAHCDAAVRAGCFSLAVSTGDLGTSAMKMEPSRPTSAKA